MENKRSFNRAWYNEDPANTDIKSDDVERTWLGGPREERGPDARARTACTFRIKRTFARRVTINLRGGEGAGVVVPDNSLIVT